FTRSFVSRRSPPARRFQTNTSDVPLVRLRGWKQHRSKTTREPSGEYDGDRSARPPKWRRRTIEPLRRTISIEKDAGSLVAQQCANAISVPSGDHAGWTSDAPLVSRRG